MFSMSHLTTPAKTASSPLSITRVLTAAIEVPLLLEI